MNFIKYTICRSHIIINNTKYLYVYACFNYNVDNLEIQLIVSELLWSSLHNQYYQQNNIKNILTANAISLYENSTIRIMLLLYISVINEWGDH